MLRITSLPFIHPQAYHCLEYASDFMMDHVYHGFMSMDDVLFQQYPYPRHMHKGIEREELNKIWGMGYTTYGLLPTTNQVFPILDSDLIVIPLHHTMVDKNEMFFNYIKGILAQIKCPIVIIDGWDQPEYSEDIAKLGVYFKRELEDHRTTALPISFAIPEEKFSEDITVKDLTNKRYDFSPMVPANFSWNHPHSTNYHRFKTEEEYYKQYHDSWFGYNCKKGGWQSGRLGEIIINNCLPYFTDIEIMPKKTWSILPRELMIEAKKIKGVYPGTITEYNPHLSTFIGDTRQIKCGEERGYIDFNEFDLDKYYSLLLEIKRIYKEKGTTKALAKYILEKSL